MDILLNKAYKDYNRLSRYSVVPYYYNKLDDKYMYGTGYQLNLETSYSLYRVTANTSTLDELSLKFYGNPTYYWIIADFNRIQDPYIQLSKGMILKIPVLSDIKFNVSQDG